MENVGKIISKHNNKILRGNESANPPCQCEEECPVEGKCNLSGVIYQATLTSHGGTKIQKYVGLTERKFINRMTEHYTNFETRNKNNSTTLSRKVWKLKDQNQNFE